MNGYIKINGVRYSPQSLNITYDSLASAEIHITYIRNKMVKLDITMPPADARTYTALINAVQGKANLSVAYWDPSTGAEITKQMYCSNSKAEWYSGVITSNGILTGLSFSLIEM